MGASCDQKIYGMKNILAAIILGLLLLVVFLISVLIFTDKNYQILKKDKEALILKNDSLHVLQLQTKTHLLTTLKQVDSLEVGR